jgi:hypothetical protein
MAQERHPVETTYRGRRYRGEWYVANGQIHVVCAQGSKSGPVGFTSALPSETAKGLLRELLRRADPKRPFFYWG